MNDIAFDAEVEHPDKTMSVGDKNVSKEHATILYDQKQYFLADLGSVNSTFLKVPNELMLREGIVFDICKDNLVVIHQVLTNKPPCKFNRLESSETIDPYSLLADGKLIWEEFNDLNDRRNEYLAQEEGYEHKEKIELRFLPHNKGNAHSQHLGTTESEIISITKAEVEEKGKIWIGRGLESDIRIQGDIAVSRQH